MPQCAGPGWTRAIVAPGCPASRVKGGRESREVARAVQKFFGVARARSRLHAEAAVSANLALPLLGRAFRMGGICPALSREPNARRRIRPFKAAIGAVLADNRRDRLASKAYMPSPARSEEHTSELQSLMRISYAVFCLKKKKKT